MPADTNSCIFSVTRESGPTGLMLRKEHFGMYSKIAAGVSFVNTKLHQYVEGAAHEQDKNWMFNWQASLIGIEAGNRLRGFAEFGMGEQGAILIGIRYNF